ncbi:MAG: MmgE/PrpD family protein [Burkholderiales bacterium]|nr:MmgE/PrpD family protein [Burkholderiales bacterium]
MRILGERVATASIGGVPPAERAVLEQAVRASLLCTWIGVQRESWVWPYSRGARAPAARMLAGLFDSLGGIGRLGTLAGAADLDPMDPGPSHTVLPATLAACVAAGVVGPRDDDTVASSVLAGVEAGWRLRRSISSARPGIGFHSAGVYGAIAAAAAAARALRLDGPGCTNAIGIALTRAAGLAINSAASMIGMTHFGWGSAHGLEAALLASEGWDCARRPNFDHPCRLNTDQGWKHASSATCCG